MKLPEVFYIHALAQLVFDAGARGDHPLPESATLDFLYQIMHDRHLRTDRAKELFDECHRVEIERNKLRRSTRLLTWRRSK